MKIDRGLVHFEWKAWVQSKHTIVTYTTGDTNHV